MVLCGHGHGQGHGYIWAWPWLRVGLVRVLTSLGAGPLSFPEVPLPQGCIITHIPISMELRSNGGKNQLEWGRKSSAGASAEESEWAGSCSARGYVNDVSRSENFAPGDGSIQNNILGTDPANTLF